MSVISDTGSKVNVYTLSLCILKKGLREFYIPNFDHINIFVLTQFDFVVTVGLGGTCFFPIFLTKNSHIFLILWF